MSQFSLPTILDEIIILHSAIATRLLTKFPDAYGVTFSLSENRSYAMARMDVPEGYSDGYREAGLDELSNSLLQEIAPRMTELYDIVSPVITENDGIFLSAVRNTEKNGLAAVGGIELRGTIVGGIGAQSIHRQVLVSEDRVLATGKSGFELTAIIEDAETVKQIEAVAEQGFAATWEVLQKKKLFLNSSVAKKAEITRLRRWLDHFPSPSDAIKFHMSEQVCRISTVSSERPPFLAVRSDDVLATKQSREQIGSAGLEVLVFDPLRGLSQNVPQSLKIR